MKSMNSNSDECLARLAVLLATKASPVRMTGGIQPPGLVQLGTVGRRKWRFVVGREGKEERIKSSAGLVSPVVGFIGQYAFRMVITSETQVGNAVTRVPDAYNSVPFTGLHNYSMYFNP